VVREGRLDTPQPDGRATRRPGGVSHAGEEGEAGRANAGLLDTTSVSRPSLGDRLAGRTTTGHRVANRPGNGNEVMFPVRFDVSRWPDRCGDRRSPPQRPARGGGGGDVWIPACAGMTARRPVRRRPPSGGPRSVGAFCPRIAERSRQSVTLHPGHAPRPGLCPGLSYPGPSGLASRIRTQAAPTARNTPARLAGPGTFPPALTYAVIPAKAGIQKQPASLDCGGAPPL